MSTKKENVIYFKTKKINGKEVPYDTSNDKSLLTASGIITKKLNGVTTTAESRMTKLNNEFKPGNANQEFRDKFYKALQASSKVAVYIQGDNINTSIAKSLTSSALSDLQELQQFASRDTVKYNALFEKALFDTNAGGIAHGVLFVMMGGLNVLAMNDKHEFMDKLGREIDDLQKISVLVSELETTLSSDTA